MKKILITGATDGIGKLTASMLAEKNYHLLIHGRNGEKVNKVVEEISNKSGNKNVEGFIADFSTLDEVRKLSAEISAKFDSLDVLINNAGVGMADPRYSSDGYELRFAVNYLAPFLLTRLLLPLLKKAAPSRIVNVSSAGQYPLNFNDLMSENDFDGTKAYRRSKIALIMHTIDLAEELKSDGVTVNSMHPGTYLDTNMVRRSEITPWGKPESGAEAEVYLTVSDELDGVTGKYFDVMSESPAHKQAYDENARKQLWDLSFELTDLNGMY